jgi:hypothetical protein
MKLKEYRDDFYTYSGKASDLSRQLAFAGIALIWLFKKESVGGSPAIPRELILPGFFIVGSLGLDLLHYCVAAAIWRCFYRSKEKAGVTEKADLTHSELLELPIFVIFCAKLALIFLAYLWILRFLWQALSFQ